mmetsp:Transcript_18212/g.41950  ORF Transcript_18212/g.41950 Transcript_18212/m.41950 type:complete len:624 (+) Transcript_18212:208-2079(+)
MTPTVKSFVLIFGSSFLMTSLILKNDNAVVDAFTPSRYFDNYTQRGSKVTIGNRFLFRGGSEKMKRTSNERQCMFMTSKDEVVTPSSTRTNVTLTFPPFHNIMDLMAGDYIASDAFTCCAPAEHDKTNKKDVNNADVCGPRHQFRVKMYPRGGVGNKQLSSSSSTNKLPLMLQARREEVVSLYLQYLGLEGNTNDACSDKNDMVNATFALRLKGKQRQQRFDIEWRAGFQFTSDASKSNLNQGIANDFGFPLMQTNLLQEFMGIVDNEQMYDPTPVIVEAEVLIHSTILERSLLTRSVQNGENIGQQLSSVADIDTSSGGFFNEDIRRTEDGNTYEHDTERVRVGKIVVPVLSRLKQRPQLFEQGTYPGVEYRILRIIKNGEERFTSCPGAEYELKPIYPLVSQLERQWPVRVSEQDIPKLYTPSMYNILSVFGSVFTAAIGLITAFLLSQAISLFFIPSKSMDPTLMVGDVLLVDKLSSRTIVRQSSSNEVGDIVLFSPPSELKQIVARSGGNLNSRDLFVKRVAAINGDKVTVYKDGKVEVNDENVVDGQRDFCEAEPLGLIEKYINPRQNYIVNSKEVFVMGDCSSVSVDSRVWGPLETENIVGRPIVRIWPLDRFGKIE